MEKQNTTNNNNNNQNSDQDLQKAEKYKEQIQFLEQNGFKKLRKLMRVLERFQGDKEKALNFLKEKQAQKQQRVQKFTQFEQQIQFLKEQGDFKIQKIIKALQKVQGDQQKALELLQKKIQKKKQQQQEQFIQKENLTQQQQQQQQKTQEGQVGEDDKKFFPFFMKKKCFRLNEIAQKYKPQFESIINQGYLFPQRALIFLEEFQGDEKKVIEKLSKIKNAENQFEKQKEIAQKVQYFFQNEIYDLNKILKSLKKFDYDEKEAVTFLKAKSISIQDLQVKYSEQMKFIILKGFYKPKRILKILEEFEGDKDKALEKLEKQRKQFLNLFEEQEIKEKDQSKTENQFEKLKHPHFGKHHQFGGFGGRRRHFMKMMMMNNNNNNNNNQPYTFSSDECEDKNSKPFAQVLDPKIEQIYIDANNLIFVEEPIRNMFIQNQKEKAQKAMIDIFRAFSQKKADQIKYTLVLFDIIKQKSAEENFVVDSARPSYPTSDDYLADICQVVEKNLQEKVLFITSDVGLQKRLWENGAVNIMKSKPFFNVIKQQIGNQLFDEIINKNK